VFADVRAAMSGWGLRRPVEDGRVRALPVWLSTVPALLSGPLREARDSQVTFSDELRMFDVVSGTFRGPAGRDAD
jgi:hypothetical protein